jgi:aspartyl-tRNA(Asn)/glutamyl-tRNA(Gln) amidotransferase subunit C
LVDQPSATVLIGLDVSKTTELDVGYVAHLARLNLTEQETQLFEKQLSDVLEHAAKLGEIDVSHVAAAAHVIPLSNVFREDEPRDWFTAEEALSNAPHKTNNLFIVTKVVE